MLRKSSLSIMFSPPKKSLIIIKSIVFFFPSLWCKKSQIQDLVFDEPITLVSRRIGHIIGSDYVKVSTRFTFRSVTAPTVVSGYLRAVEQAYVLIKIK